METLSANVIYIIYFYALKRRDVYDLKMYGGCVALHHLKTNSTWLAIIDDFERLREDIHNED